jgi:transcriptional regulator with XRE-family HTH domain
VTSPQTTLADMLSQAIAEEDDGNVSRAARKLHVSRPTVYNWLRGGVPQRPAHPQAIADYCGVTVNEVLHAAYASSVTYALDGRLHRANKPPAKAANPGQLGRHATIAAIWTRRPVSRPHFAAAV